MNHYFTFISTTPLEIKPYPTQLKGLQIHRDLEIKIDPPCKILSIYVSSGAGLEWSALDSNGNPTRSTPPSPISGFGRTITFKGDISQIKLKGANEEEIHSVCCNDC